MSRHSHDRTLTDDQLNRFTVAELYDLAAHCDVEPADERVCDACAAYLIGQEKENAEKVFQGLTLKVEPTSCSCGGNYAWLKQRPSGAWEMVGCVCHTDIQPLLEPYLS